MFKNLLASILCIMFALSATLGQTLGEQERSKVHPRLQQLLESWPAMSLAKGTAPSGITLRERSDGQPAVAVIIQTDDPKSLESRGIHLNSRFEGLATALVTPSELSAIAGDPSVRFVDPGVENEPLTDVSMTEIGATALHAGMVNGTPYTGSGVIVLVYDTGIDWAHLDFRVPTDTTKSRILAIWDQTLSASGGETPPAGFSYGVEYTKAQIEDEIDGTPANVVRERDTNGHGTHVMGTAAGNGRASDGRYTGVAPEADLVVVKGGNGSFSEPGMIDGLTYAQQVSVAFGKPVVVNWSIGGHSGPHDGTRPYEAAVNSFSATPGRVVVISAGNDGSNKIHISGTVPLPGTATITLTVPTYTPNSGTNNDGFTLDVWLDDNSSITATVRTPGNTYSYVRNAGEWGTAPTSTQGTIYLSNNISTLNGKRNIYLDVSDATSNVPAQGTWTLEITGAPSSVAFHGWLARRTVGSTYVALTAGDTLSTVSMPGTSEQAITVGSYVTKWTWKSSNGSMPSYTGTDRTGNISTFSSVGPTRDARQKPDLSAPGQGIVAALSSASTQSAAYVVPGGKHFLTQGTSMAAPHVTGAVALLLGTDAGLTAATIKSTLRSTANKDAFTGGVWSTNFGEGKLDVLEAMVSTLYPGGTAAQTVLSYGGPTKYYLPLPGSFGTKFAVRFTAPFDGQVVGMMILPNGGVNGIKGTGNLAVTVAQNAVGSVAGVPGTPLGPTVAVPFSKLIGGAWNVIDVIPAQASVTAGTEFHVTVEVAGVAGDTLQCLIDDGTTSPTSRTSAYANGSLGTQWYNFIDGNFWGTGYNMLIKAVVTGITDVEETVEVLPTSLALEQNYPNPFNPSTVIRYAVPAKANVRLTVYDMLGRAVVTLVDEPQGPGHHEVRWNGRTAAGSPVATGVYFYALEAGATSLTRKMLLVK